jgi:anti-anti-sigma regulatory factor
MDKWDVGFRQDGKSGWLQFPQNISGQTRETAFKAFNELSHLPVKAMCLDFSLTQYINSSGIGIIISLVETALQHRYQVYTYGLGTHYVRLFRMVGLADRTQSISDVNELHQLTA